MRDIPVMIDSSGAQPTPPETLLKKLLEIVAKQVPDYTASLPAALITDLATTAVGALTINDLAMVDTINSVTPYGANIPMLEQLGSIYGIPKGRGSNNAVYVTFTGTAGYLIERGFRVSDGNQGYEIQTPTTIPASGQTALVYCLAINSGIWAIPAGTVTKIQSSVPKEITLICTNPTNGIPGKEETDWSIYRAQVLQAGMVTSLGTPQFLKSQLQKIDGVRANLIAFKLIAPQTWSILVGGGDIYQVAGAIFRSIPDISTLSNKIPSGAGSNPPKKVNVSIIDEADTYTIPYLIPNSQNVALNLTCKLVAGADTGDDVIATLAIQPIVEAINGIQIGDPINGLDIKKIFIDATKEIVNPRNVANVTLTVLIDGKTVPPLDGTELVYGDAYSYFLTSDQAIKIKKAG